MELKEFLQSLADILSERMGDNTANESETRTAKDITYSVADILPAGKAEWFAACGLDPFAGSFMKPVIQHADYFEIETRNGTELVPADIVGGFRGTYLEGFLDSDAPEWGQACDALRSYVESAPDQWESIEGKTGFLARMSAPGYMDCTDWSAFDSADAAYSYLLENYADQE